MTQINLNTYYMLPRWFIALNLTKKACKISNKDLKKGFYIVVEFLNIEFKVSFKYIFGTNSKIKGIKSLDFNNATLCDSFRLGYCQIGVKKHCYAFNFEYIYYNDYISNGEFKDCYYKCGSYFKGLFMVYALNKVYNNLNLKNRLITYINDNIKYLRFNVNSDFKNINDYLFLVELVLKCPNTVFYGYSARNDILDKYYKPINNLTVNGSNKMYTNRYYATMSLKEYFLSNLKCVGECLRCSKCFKLKNKVICTLFHHSNADSILNTKENRLFLVELINAIDSTLNLTETDLKAYKGIFKSLDSFMVKKGCDLSTYDITSIKEFLDWVYYYPKLEFKDLINDSKCNKDILKYYGLL